MSEDLKKTITAHKAGEAVDLQGIFATNETNQSFTVLGKGKNEGRLENGVLAPSGQTLIVDGAAFTTGIIPGIERIWLTSESGILYDFTVHVQGACPKGEWDNKLLFKDESGDEYTLRIFSTSAKEHTVNYHSPKGNIVQITWDI